MSGETAVDSEGGRVRSEPGLVYGPWGVSDAPYPDPYQSREGPRAPVPAVLEMNQATADMADLESLARLYRFDLFMYLRQLTELGLPTLRAEIDDSPAIGTASRVIRYKLSEGLQICLAALRARHLNADKVE